MFQGVFQELSLAKQREDNAAIQRSAVNTRDDHDDVGARVKLIRKQLLSYAHFYRDCSNNEAS